MFGWLNAKPQHLAKFIWEYQTIFPDSAILVIQSHLQHLPRPDIAQADVKPAINVLREILGETSTPVPENNEALKPELLVHLFSNGGSCTLYYHFTQLYQAHVQRSLPHRVTILDSAPSTRFAYNEVLAGVILSLPPSGDRETVQLPAAQRLCASLDARFRELGPGEDYMCQWAEQLNDPGQAHEARRLYLYSDMDNVNPRWGIESHADKAEARGFVVRRELFLGSNHISRSYFLVYDSSKLGAGSLTFDGTDSRNQPERYWRAVKEIWDGQLRAKI